MKNISLFFVAIIAVCSLLFVSCSKSSDTTPVVPGAVEGSWRVSLYFDNTDETADFAGYAFTFNNNGQLTAVNGSNTVTGTWSSSGSTFNINFGTDPLFSGLNNNWLTVEKTSTSIKLKDDNPAQDDQLQFVKL